MDALDRRILEILRADARTPNVAIAGRLGVTEGTVRNRIRRMVADRTIRSFTVDAEEDGSRALVLIRTRTDRTPSVVRALRGLAKDLFETSGLYDIAVLLRCEDMEHLNTTVDQIRAIRGVVETHTLVALTSKSGQSSSGVRGRPRPPGMSSPQPAGGYEPYLSERAGLGKARARRSTPSGRRSRRSGTGK